MTTTEIEKISEKVVWYDSQLPYITDGEKCSNMACELRELRDTLLEYASDETTKLQLTAYALVEYIVVIEEKFQEKYIEL